jgi:hypothetical protein
MSKYEDGYKFGYAKAIQDLEQFLQNVNKNMEKMLNE